MNLRTDIGPCALFVEGFHDQEFFRSLINNLDYSIGGTVNIVQYGGRSKLQLAVERILSALRSRETQALGIVIDADSDAEGPWNDVRELLKEVKFDPEMTASLPPPDGYIGSCNIAGHSVKFGIWVMPDNISQGQLEDFVLQMVPRSDVVRPHAKRYILSLPDSIVEPNSIRLSKHIAHAWLSAYYPGWGFSDALEGGQLDIDANVSELSKLKLWVGMLYSLL